MKRAGWLAALLLLVLVNAIVLAGVAWNRSGEPDSTMQLTERELPLYYRSSMAEENTGVAFRLNLHNDVYSPDWLNADKLRALGFSIPDTGSNVDDREERLRRALPRQAWVVLEFDGPAWQAALADEERRLAALHMHLSDGKVTRLQKESAEEALTRMQQSGSRLVAVDAGKDAAALRAAYPDTTRYLITGAEVRMWAGRSLSEDGETGPLSIEGHLQIPGDRIHVPLQHQRILQAVLGGDLQGDRRENARQLPRYAVRLHYGRRYEPWVEEIVAIKPE